MERLVWEVDQACEPLAESQLEEGLAPDMKELGVAYLSIASSAVSQRLLTDGSRRQDLLQGDLNGGATYYYARSKGVWPQRPPVVMPHPDPNFAALRVTWAPLSQQRLQLLAAKIGLSADPPC